jgi:hypothetical protein
MDLAGATLSQAQAQANFFECATNPAKCRNSNNQSTPMPAPVPATSNQPARNAAIGNVQPTVPSVQVQNNQATKLTTNPIDTQKKTSGNEVWVSFNPSIFEIQFSKNANDSGEQDTDKRMNHNRFKRSTKRRMGLVMCV